jgi:hypothetical protein
MTDKKKDKRSADQDTSAEIAFAAGRLPEEDRRKPVVPTPSPIPALPTQGRIIPPVRQPVPDKRVPRDSFVTKYLIWATLVVAVLVAIKVCTA